MKLAVKPFGVRFPAVALQATPALLPVTVAVKVVVTPVKVDALSGVSATETAPGGGGPGG